jgi:hypothetical protein
LPHLLDVSAVFLMAGVASAQTYPPPTTPPEIPGSGTSTTTIISPGPNGSYRATTQHSIDMYRNRVTRKDIYREGIAGSSETHTTAMTDPWDGSTTTA